MKLKWDSPIYKDPHWFCVKTGPKQETRVLRQLVSLPEISAYCPRIAYKKLRASGPARVSEAMFPRYVFARFLLPEQVRGVLSLTGVRGLVQFGGRPSIVVPGIIEKLREITNDEPEVEVFQEVRPGMNVVIGHGPYRGLEVLVSRVLPAGERVAVLLEVLGAEREVEIQREALLPPIEHPLAVPEAACVRAQR